MPAPDTTVESQEIAKFEAMADAWWDRNGKFAPLHRMNPCRLDYITRQIAAEFGRDRAAPSPFAGLKILDIGCGGGLLSEPMARLGAEVIGADAGAENIRIAEAHAAQMGLDIDYRHTTAEALASEGHRFDAVLALEIIEHVADIPAFLEACAALLKPGGLLVLSTLNRTAKSYAMAIVGAEYVLRWLPKGTHDWSKFVTPDEAKAGVEAAGLDMVDRKGMVYDPIHGSWALSDRDLSVNYITTSVKPA